MIERDYSWKDGLTKACEKNGEKFEDLKIFIADGELERKFDNGFGGEEGAPFTAWGPGYVYFPICYDGAEWVGCAPRNPCEIALKHQGGG
jgi:hypothetical protein